MPMYTCHQVIRDAADALKQAGIESAMLDARLLLCHALRISQEQLWLDDKRVLNADESMNFEQLVARRVRREPLSHIIGKREFYGRDFVVSPHVLDPRSDSETLIEAVLHWVKQRGLLTRPISILDLGTGSGCLLLTLLAEIPNAEGVGVDLSQHALRVAQKNAQALKLSDRAAFLCARWSEAIEKKFDIVISNPPYIPSLEIEGLMPEVREHEPRLALDGGKDGLDSYREIANHLLRVSTPDGLSAIEIGINQQDAVADIMKKAGLRPLNIWDDLANIPRCITLTL